MKTNLLRLVLIGLGSAALSLQALALTINIPVTRSYMEDNPGDFRIKVTRASNGLLSFTITRNLSHPMYLVAHLSVHHRGQVIAESHSPAFSRNRDNTFYFSLSPGDVAESTFELGESAFTESQGQAIPIVGTTNYQFRLEDFVPPDLLKAQ